MRIQQRSRQPGQGYWYGPSSIVFLVGENERTYPAKQAIQRLHQVAPQVEALIVAHADHYMLLIKPDWVVSSTLRFLQDLSTTT